jgi:tRNA-modifying protein YgfZ
MPLRQFQTLQQSCGAIYTDRDQAYPVASHFGSPEKEYQRAHESAVLFDLSHRDQFELRGKDRAKFLHNFCTNEIKNLQPDQCCEAFLTNVQSRILGHVFVFNQGDSLWLDTAPGASAAIINHLDRYIILEDADFDLRNPEFGTLYLTGPKATEILKQAGIQIESLAVNQQLQVTNSDSQLTVRRLDWLQQPGYLCSLQYVKIADFWTSLIEAGATPAGEDTFDALRIEAQFPIYGADLSEENLAQEADRTDQTISFKKGCYLGQEPIARIDALGHVNRELRSIGLDQDWVPPKGAKVMAGEPDKLEEVGTITSSARSFGEYPAVAMAMVRRGSNEPGTKVCVVSDQREATGTVFTSLD